MPRRNGIGIELLADPTRRRIIGALALGARRPSRLAKELGLSEPATCRQLRLLRTAGLVTSTRSLTDGRATLYVIEPHQMRPITAWLAGVQMPRPTAGHLGID
jgi:predicted transcriptional regulator